MSIIRFLLPHDPFTTQIHQTLDNADTQPASGFQLHNGVLYHRACIYIPDGPPQLLKLP